MEGTEDISENIDLDTDTTEFDTVALIGDTPVLYVDGDVEIMKSVATTNYDFLTSARDIFSGVIRNEDRNRLLKGEFNGLHYVAWRDNSNYYLAYGPGLELSNSGNVFTADTVTYITYTYSYNSTRNYSVSTDTNFRLSVGNSVVCSDLGQYPNLDDGRDVIEQAEFIALMLCAGVFFITTLFRSIGKRAR